MITELLLQGKDADSILCQHQEKLNLETFQVIRDAEQQSEDSYTREKLNYILRRILEAVAQETSQWDLEDDAQVFEAQNSNNRIPIAIATYERHLYLGQVLNALCKCTHLNQFMLITSEEPEQRRVSELIASIDFMPVERHLQPKRLGANLNTCMAVHYALRQSSTAIMLEEDVVPAQDFLSFMLWGLEAFQKTRDAVSIGGYQRRAVSPHLDEVKSAFKASWFNAWGWGTWRDRWSRFFRSKLFLHSSVPWDILFKHYMFFEESYSIVPSLGRTLNIGLTGTYMSPTDYWQRYHTRYWHGNGEYPTIEPDEFTLSPSKTLHSRPVTKSRGPQKAWISITDKCNNQCVWCYAKSARGTQSMAYKLAEETLRWLRSIDCKECVLVGGEPTLHPQLSRIFANGKSLGIKMVLITNGRRFSDPAFCKEMIAAGLESKDVTFSMHASSPQDSEALTGETAYFEEFEAGFDNLTRLGVQPGVSILINKPLIARLDSMMHWVASRKARLLVINIAGPIILQQEIDASFMLPPDDLGREVIRLLDVINTLGIKALFVFNLPFCVLSRAEIERLLVTQRIRTECAIQTGSAILFNVRGELITCNHLLNYPVCDRKTLKQAFETRQSFLAFWESDRLTSVRGAANAYRTEHCTICDLWNLCGGGCSLFWSYYDPEHYIKGWGKDREQVVQTS
jgi:radical SAM protein with 4Fe4S-binding SPASM domain